MKKVLFTATVDSHILHFHIPYLKLFKENGYEVHVATNGDEKIPYCDVKHKISFERSPIKLNNLKAIKDLKKIIDKENFEIIHTHTPMGSVVTRLAAMSARKKGTRVIYTAHGFHFFKGAPKKNWIIFYPIEKMMSRVTDDLILINSEDYNLAKKKFHAKRTHLVPGVGVDPNKFNFEFPEKEKNELRKELGLKKKDFVMIYPAELNANKNQGMLIEVMRKLIKKNRNFKLLLPGIDSYNGKYQEMVKEYKLEDNIKILGYRKDIPKLLRISNLAVSTSRREGLGLNLIEATLCRLPVIAVKNRGHEEIIQNGYNGIIIEQDSLDELYNSIIKLYNDKNLRNEYQKNGYKTSQKFLLKNIMKDIKKIYNIDYIKKIKVIFAHDAVIKKDKDNNFFIIGGLGGKEFTQKYLLNREGKIIYYTRYESKKDNNQNKYQLIEKNTSIIENSEIYKSPIDLFTKYSKIKKEACNVISKGDVCVVRLPSVLGVIAFWQAKKMNVPTYVELVGCPYEPLKYYGGIKGHMFAPVMKLLVKHVVKNAKYIQYVTQDFLQKKYPNKKGNVLKCSDVCIPKIEEINLKRRIKKIKNYNDSTTYKIGLVGPLDVNYKGHEVVIKALSVLKNSHKLELHLLGEGNKERWIEFAGKYNVSDLIVFDGVLPSGEPIFKWLDDIDIHVMMSKTEGLPRVLIEAMSRASVSIASNVGGIPELLDEKDLLDKDDYIGLANRIDELINDKNKQIEMAKRNFKKSKEYKYDLLSKKRNEFYNEFLNN